jgi:two-component system LytT family response regulator
MKALIIEDEQPTAQRLVKLLNEADPEIEVVAILDSVSGSIDWLMNNSSPDVVFQDIHLADGSCFEIYKTVKTNAPVIFTTAYDQYAIEAFKVNSIDYLLKPISREQLKQSLIKLREIARGKPSLPDYQSFAHQLEPNHYQKRFMVRFGQKIKVIETNDIAYWYTTGGNQFFKTFGGDAYPSDFSLEKLETMLDPEQYFRINRQMIIHIKAIKEMYTYSKSRIKIDLHPTADFEVISSTERSGPFKRWLSGERQ